MDAIRVGICDDEKRDLTQILDLMVSYDKTEQLQIDSFLRSDDLFAASKQRGFDIVILDIEMEPPTGFEIAKKLVKFQNPPVILFATKSSYYAAKGYGIAIRYLQKPIKQIDFFEAMDAALSDAFAHRLTFHIDTTLVSVVMREIQYIESLGHYVVVHTATDAYRFRSTLKETMVRLPKRFFTAPHKSYVVNLEHVRSASSVEVVLDCGISIPISRRRLQEFNDALYSYLGR